MYSPGQVRKLKAERDALLEAAKQTLGAFPWPDPLLEEDQQLALKMIEQAIRKGEGTS